MRRVALGVTMVMTAALFSVQTASGQTCPPTPTYDPSVTPPTTAIAGYPSNNASTTAINSYFQLVDAQTDRVTTSTFATSVNGTPLVYSLVGTPENVANVDAIAADQKRLRDPRVTTQAEADQLAASIPAIAWYTANVHGNEQSGADAAVEMLYRLAARTDCEVVSILDNLVVGVMPIQNPDGRDANSRTNAYTFDMNRDWFAGTQAETAGKLPLLAKYPPIVLVDAHEMGGNSFFFPPNNDPIYHEISPQSIDWIDNIYGTANAAAANANGFDFFNCTTQPSCIYDLFYMGYGDTVPTTAFTSAGMTFEKGSGDSDQQRWFEQSTIGWSTIKAASDNKASILSEYYTAHVNALQQGAAGQLQPNRLYRPGEVINEVPTAPVRHYFIPNDRAYSDVARMIRRLLTFGVEVYQLTSDVQVSDLRTYGRPGAPGVVAKGTYWIPMNQPQKHWVQAVLHEDNWVPFPYFYDTTGWSNPQVLNLNAKFTGDVLTSVPATRLGSPPTGGVVGGTSRRTSIATSFYWFPGDTGMSVAAALSLERAGVQVRRLLQPHQAGTITIPEGAFVVPSGIGVATAVTNAALEFVVRVNSGRGAVPSGVELTTPKVGVFQGSGESYGHLRWLLEKRWKIPYDVLTAQQMITGTLTSGGYDVLIVGGYSTTNLTPALAAIDAWIQAGGIYVGTARPGNTGGTNFAVLAGWTSSTAAPVPGMQVPGTIFRTALGNTDSHVTLGASDPNAYWYHLGEAELSPSTTGLNALVFPSSEPEFFTSGYATGHEGLKGSAALVDETRGSGRVILFSGEPNFRGFVEGASFFLANSLIYPLGAAAQTVDTASSAAAADVAAAQASAPGPETGPGRPIRIEVPAADSGAALAVLHAFTANVRVEEAHGSAFLEIPNPEGLTAEDHPFSRDLLPALDAAGVTIRSAIL